MDKWVGAGVLELLPGRARNRVHLARGVLAIIESDVSATPSPPTRTPGT